MKKNKFKKKCVGAPRLSVELKRVNLITTVSPATIEWLDNQAGSRGRIIDLLVSNQK